MRPLRVGVILAALIVGAVSATPVSARVSRAIRLVTIHPEGKAAQRGIGPVRLEEPQSNVTRALGPGQQVTNSEEAGESFTEYHYRSGSITIEVVYGNGLVASVDTTSPKAILFGHRLSQGLPAFKSILHRRHGWRIDSCDHRVFTALAPGGPGTGIEWDAGKLKLVQIDVGGVLDACASL